MTYLEQMKEKLELAEFASKEFGIAEEAMVHFMNSDIEGGCNKLPGWKRYLLDEFFNHVEVDGGNAITTLDMALMSDTKQDEPWGDVWDRCRFTKLSNDFEAWTQANIDIPLNGKQLAELFGYLAGHYKGDGEKPYIIYP
jgi:hypothetical protein